MNKGRLLKLARFLETLPVKAFDISSWQEKPQTKREGKQPGQCGFVGCAVGWAAHAKLVPGLKLRPIAKRSGIMNVTYKGLEDWEAVCEAFGLKPGVFIAGKEEDEGGYLFSSGGYGDEPYFSQPTPYDVARRIRQFVKRGHI